MTVLETRGLRKVYGSGNREVRALNGVFCGKEKLDSVIWLRRGYIKQESRWGALPTGFFVF